MRMSEEEYQSYLKSRGIKTAIEEKPKKSKYNNNHTWIDGICFDSNYESELYSELKLRLKAGDIAGFCLQPIFVLVEGNTENRAITWKADYIVFNNDGSYEVIDRKGFESEQWKRTYKQITLKYPNVILRIEGKNNE